MFPFTRLFILGLCLLFFAQSTVASPRWRKVSVNSPEFEAKINRIFENAKAKAERNETSVVPDKSEGPSGGVFFQFPKANCKRTNGRPFIIRPTDHCFSTEESLRIKTPARCDNGTNAMIAKFHGKNCQDAFEEPLVEVNDDTVGKCIDTADIGSMAFWCDGVPGVDLSQKPKPAGKNVGLGIGIGLGVVIVFGILVGAIAFMWKRGLGEKVMALFKRREGQIQL